MTRINNFVNGIFFLFLVCLTCLADDPAATPVTHEQFQACHADGSSSFDDSGPTRVLLEGVILNMPEEIVSPYFVDDGSMGGQWQIYIQPTDPDDHAGTAIYIGQNYYCLPFITDPADTYSESAWDAELSRINYDPNDTFYRFCPGDRVTVNGKYLFYRGKLNINEQHHVTPDNDFIIRLVEPAAGLPEPEIITLDDIKNSSDDFIFDQTCESGCEYYQARLVRINDVQFVNTANWGPNGQLTITDGNKTFPVLLGLGRGFEQSCNLADRFDIIGIFDQESGYTNHTNGYRIWVPNYDGNGLVLTDRAYRRGNLRGDSVNDGRIDLLDLAALAGDWLLDVPGF